MSVLGALRNKHRSSIEDKGIREEPITDMDYLPVGRGLLTSLSAILANHCTYRTTHKLLIGFAKIGCLKRKNPSLQARVFTGVKALGSETPDKCFQV